MLSGLTLFSTEHPVGEVFPGKDQISHCQFSSVAYGSLCWVEASWVFLSLLWHVHWCHSFSANVWSITLIILMVIAYADTRKHNLTAKYPIFWLLQHLYPLFCNVPCALGVWMFSRCICWDWSPHLWCLSIVVFWNGCLLFQRELSLMRSEDYFYLWV